MNVLINEGSMHKRRLSQKYCFSFLPACLYQFSVQFNFFNNKPKLTNLIEIRIESYCIKLINDPPSNGERK